MPPPLPKLPPARPPAANVWVIVGLTVAVFLAGVVVFAVSTAVYFRTRSNQAMAAELAAVDASRQMMAQTAAVQVERPPLREAPPRGVRPRPTEVERLVAPAAGPTSEPGISYTNIIIPAVPWSVHVLKIDRTRPDLTFYTALAQDKVLGVSLIRDQARAVPAEFGRAIAGVNGDFYDRDNATFAGDPRGLQIVRGELVSAPDTVAVWFDPEGHPHLDAVRGTMYVTWPDGKKTPFGVNQRPRPGVLNLYTPTYGPSTRAGGQREILLEKSGDGPWLPLRPGETYRARVRAVRPEGNTPLSPDTIVLSVPPDLAATVPAVSPGATVQLSTATTPDLRGVQMAIAGGPAIIEKGKPFPHHTAPPGVPTAYSERSKYERHPRSAIGWNTTHLFLVTVDGRQPGLSMGMKLAELGEFMLDLGCTDAMNLDGGKSAQMWMNGRILNSPHQGEDTVANSILVVRRAAP